MTKTKITKLELKERLYRQRYILPNAVTIGNMFCGFLTIIYASSGRFSKAAIAIFIAILLDGLDGRVARRFNATSRFGLEFDSFSDLVSFGVAPAILMYHWCFQIKADEFGVFIGFVYIICAASRLARFNISEENLSSFQGLPSPAAAAMIGSIVFSFPIVEPGAVIISAGSILMLFIAYLMVSNIEFFKC